MIIYFHTIADNLHIMENLVARRSPLPPPHTFTLSHTHTHTYTEYSTSSTNLLNRTYNLDQYFYCERCKTFYLTENDGENNTDIEPCENNTSVCSNVDMTKAVIYPGDIEKAGIKSESSIEKDYGKMREVFKLGHMYNYGNSVLSGRPHA